MEDDGGELVVAGWGRTEKGRSSAVLQFTHLRRVARPLCQQEYRLAGSQGRLGPLTQGLDILPSQVSSHNYTTNIAGFGGYFAFLGGGILLCRGYFSISVPPGRQGPGLKMIF